MFSIIETSKHSSYINQELGADWQRRLKEFDFQPMAAASIGQVGAHHSFFNLICTLYYEFFLFFCSENAPEPEPFYFGVSHHRTNKT